MYFIHIFVLNLFLIITYITIFWGSQWLIFSSMSLIKCHLYYRNQFRETDAAASVSQRTEEEGMFEDMV